MLHSINFNVLNLLLLATMLLNSARKLLINSIVYAPPALVMAPSLSHCGLLCQSFWTLNSIKGIGKQNNCSSMKSFLKFLFTVAQYKRYVQCNSYFLTECSLLQQGYINNKGDWDRKISKLLEKIVLGQAF